MSDGTTYIKPNAKLWRRVNKVLMREDAHMGETIVTFIGEFGRVRQCFH